MPDIVDAFVVSLGLDPSDYNREIKRYREDRKKLAEENEAYNKREEDGAKRASDGIRRLRNETAGFLLMLAGANSVRQFASDILSGDAATGRFAANIGVATERVSAWEEAFKRVGGSASDAQQTLRTLNNIFQSYQLTGNRDMAGALAFFGLSERDLQNPEDALLRIADVAGRAPASERGTLTARLNMLGLSDSAVTLLSRGRVGVEQLLREVERLGLANERTTQEAQAFDNALADISQMIRGATRPAITALAQELSEFVEDEDRVNEASETMRAIFEGVWIVAKLMAGGLREVAAAFGSLQAAYDRLPEGVKGFFENIGNMLSGGQYKNAWDYLGDAVGGEMGAELKRKYGSEGTSGRSETPAILNPGPSPYASGGSGRPPARVPRGRRAVALDGNNPGGINDGAFARSQPGYVGNNGRYAAFATMQDGINAQTALLRSYVNRGYDTPIKIARRWAPDADGNNSAAYAAQIARRMGIGLNDRIGAGQLQAFQHAQAIAENANYAKRVGSGRGASSVSQSNSTTVGQIVIYTNGKDAEAIGRDIRTELDKRGLVVQAASGLRP